MAAEGSVSTGKRPMYEDLDRPAEEIIPPVDMSVPTGSNSNPSSSSRKKLKKPVNPDWPPTEYLVECRAVAAEFYRRRSLQMLQREYLNHGEAGYSKLTQDLRRELESKLEASEKFNNYSDYWLHSEFLDKTVIALTTNSVASFHYHIKKKEGATDLDDGQKEVIAKLDMVQQWAQKFSSSRHKGRLPWKESIEKRILDQCVSGCVDWLPTSVKVVTMPGHKVEGAYGKVRKVRLTKLSTIPSWIDFASKGLKTTDEKEKRRDILLEAAGCPIKHAGIIRLSFLHPETMEGFSLWWNGGSLISFLQKYNAKVPESTEASDIVKTTGTQLTPEELGWVATYRRNRVNLALSLLIIVAKCHDANYIHNDISTSNVLLHFDPWKENTVYIGLCDWGLSSRVKENEPSKYGYKTHSEMKKVKAA